MYQKKPCDGGDAMGCSNLGTAYRFGEGVPKDLAKAAELRARCAHAGHAPARKHTPIEMESRYHPYGDEIDGRTCSVSAPFFALCHPR